MAEKPVLRRRIRPLEREERKRHIRNMAQKVGKSGMYPLDAPGMPPPGPDFLIQALNEGCTTVYNKKTKAKEGMFVPGPILKTLYSRALREPGFTLNISLAANLTQPMEFIPGHIWGQHLAEWAKSTCDLEVIVPPVDGPHPAEVMVIGKIPGREEAESRRNLVGPSGDVLTEIIRKMHVKGADRWYITNLCKFKPPDNCPRVKANWVHDCLPLLHQELRIVRPKYILCLGADASKEVLGDKYTVSYMAGRVVPFTYDVRLDKDDPPEEHTAYVMTVLHPAEVARSPEKIRILESNFARFAYLIEGHNLDIAEKHLDHRLITNLEDAEDWVCEVNAYFEGRKRKDRMIAWDAEWEGQHPVNSGSYVRTIQCAWDEKKAVCFKIRHAGGEISFRDREGKPAIKRLATLLNKFMEDKRAVGHFFVSDLEWLNSIGIDPVASCPVPLEGKNGKLAWECLRNGEGWIDTAYMLHSIEETAQLGLEMLSMRYTVAPRYDIPLEDWKKEYCTRQKIPASALEGYGNCPDEILVPYAIYDADVTLRIAKSLMPLLDCDYEGNCCWESCWEDMIIQKPILRIHKNGICVDRKRVDTLTRHFMTARDHIEGEIRNWACWPSFNIRSVQHVKEFLFGENLNGKRDKEGHKIKIRPSGARSLRVKPILDTSKPPRLWFKLEQAGQTEYAAPGTGKTVLSLLAQDNSNYFQQISWVRDYRFLDQVLKSVLRVPVRKDTDEAQADDTDCFVMTDDGYFEYDAGLVASMDDDGRVRTHLYPTAETGRWKSSRPNLQNISKSRDPDYLRLLGPENYKHKLRSVLKASPGFALVEADYQGAELEGMAIMAGATTMQDHCRRAKSYPDSGFDVRGNPAVKGHHCPGDCKKCRKGAPSKEKHVCAGGCSLCGYPHAKYYDIHSNVAKLAFHLKCHPSKFGLEMIKKEHFRTLAKNVIFGIAYGRGAKAIALQAKEQGVNVTADEAQTVIDAIFKLYPELLPFFDAAKQRAVEDHWLCHCFGRYRRFPATSDFKLEGEFERQAQNFPKN
jgi:DNA polymerase